MREPAAASAINSLLHFNDYNGSRQEGPHSNSLLHTNDSNPLGPHNTGPPSSFDLHNRLSSNRFQYPDTKPQPRNALQAGRLVGPRSMQAPTHKFVRYHGGMWVRRPLRPTLSKPKSKPKRNTSVKGKTRRKTRKAKKRKKGTNEMTGYVCSDWMGWSRLFIQLYYYHL